jgi:hypothetical protein
MKTHIASLCFLLSFVACGQTNFGSASTKPPNLDKRGETPPGNEKDGRGLDAKGAASKNPIGSTIPGIPPKQGPKPGPAPATQPTSKPKPAAPALESVYVEVPRDVLGPSALVSVGWTSSSTPDSLNGWKAVVEVLAQGSQSWEVVQDTVATETRVAFVWGDRPVAPFSVRVRFVKDNVTAASKSTSWAPHVFNTAVLTRSVKCLFCHLKIEGDVGGIDFPTSDMHVASATGVRITGRLYATAGIPSVFKTGVLGGSPVAAGGFFEDYKNTEQKVFPAANDKGEVNFPRIDPESLAAAMLGKLVGYNSVAGAQAIEISKTHKGNLFLDGTATPFELAGEVFIDGDLVIKGSYKGVGTIYARNIYVIGDVKAIHSPFPYPAAESEALAHARASVARGDDALHLAALSQLVVGEVKTKLASASDIELKGIETRAKPSNPSLYEWFGGAGALVAAGQPPLQPESYINSTPQSPTWKFTVDKKTRIDVARLDAFLFSNESLVWHAHGNWLLNGGFVSPKTAMTSIIQAETGSNWCGGGLDAPDEVPDGCNLRKAILINPRNGLASHTNVIRFDYRLRSGAPGFDSIRPLFDGMNK